MRSISKPGYYWPAWAQFIENFREQTYHVRITHGQATFDFTVKAWLRPDEYYDIFMGHKNRMIEESKVALEIAAKLTT